MSAVTSKALETASASIVTGWVVLSSWAMFGLSLPVAQFAGPLVSGHANLSSSPSTLVEQGGSLGSLHEDESQGQRGGPAEDGEPQAVADRLPGRPPLGRLHPDDCPLRRDRP